MGKVNGRTERSVTQRLRDRNPDEVMSLASRVLNRKTALTAEDLADILMVSKVSILRAAKRGTLPCIRFGGSVRFDPANVSKYLMQIGSRRMSEDKK